MMQLRRGLLVSACLALLSAGPALAETSSTDLQWAQRVLTEKGYDIGGRANGQMTGPTRAALKAFQAANGLPQSGELDAATIARMTAVRTASPTMGTLSAPRPGTERVREADVKPRAAPTERVSTTGGGEVINPIIAPRELSGSGGAYTPQRPVSAEPGASGRSGDVAPVPFTPTPMPSSDSGASLMSYARPLVASVLAGTILALIGAWWMSGRRRRGSFAPASAEIEGRREPTFDRPAAGLTAGTPPSLTATRPGRR